MQSDLAAIREALIDLRKDLSQVVPRSIKNEWEIEQLRRGMDSEDGIKAQLREIRRDMPDLKILRSVIFGTIGLVLTGVGWALLRVVGIFGK